MSNRVMGQIPDFNSAFGCTTLWMQAEPILLGALSLGQ